MDKREFYDSFKSLDTLIERFKHSLSEVNCREMLVIHSLAHVAAIQLHNLFVLTSPPSRARALESAWAIVAALVQVPTNAGYIDLIMGVSIFLASHSCYKLKCLAANERKPFCLFKCY
jgi:hypothetical protein